MSVHGATTYNYKKLGFPGLSFRGHFPAGQVCVTRRSQDMLVAIGRFAHSSLPVEAQIL